MAEPAPKRKLFSRVRGDDLRAKMLRRFVALLFGIWLFQVAHAVVLHRQATAKSGVRTWYMDHAMAISMVLTISLILGTLASIIVTSRLRGRARRMDFALCKHCGYDLRKIEQPGPCPECGREFRLAELETYWKEA